MLNETRQTGGLLPLSFTSVLAGSSNLYAASMNGDIYRIGVEEEWRKLHAPESAGWTVNRMGLSGETLYVSTNIGLYSFANEEWQDEELDIPCYQYRVEGGYGYAATAYGLFCNYTGVWGSAAYSGKRVFDFLNLPQFLILAHESGISIYDRFTDDWADFRLGTGVGSICVYKGHLIGTSEHGELIMGDKKGKFERVRFGELHIFSVLKREGEVYVCTDQGLYRLLLANGQPTIFSFIPGGPITDVDRSGSELYMATLFDGIKKYTF